MTNRAARRILAAHYLPAALSLGTEYANRRTGSAFHPEDRTREYRHRADCLGLVPYHQNLPFRCRRQPIIEMIFIGGVTVESSAKLFLEAVKKARVW